MGQKSGPVKEPAEQVVKEIRRATRRQFSAEEKIRIVLSGLRGEDSIAELCRREGIVQNLYYRWSKEFLEAGKKRLAGDTARAATSDEVKDLRREASALKEVVAELMLENRLLKKSTIGAGEVEYASFKAAVAAAGRDPARVHVAPACYVCVGESEAVAQEKRAVIEATARDVDALVLLSEVLNYDFAKKPLDEPFSDEELAELSFQGFRDRVIRHSGKKNPTVRDFITVSGRGTVKEHTMFCGNPQQVADQMEEWFTAPACDGFVLAASNMPGAYDDVVRLLVPELQRRGLFQKDYAGPTLRDNLGLAIPRAADWHAARRAPVR